MSEANLRAALDGQLNTIPNPLPIAWENTEYTQDGNAYLSQLLIPAETITVGVEQGGSDVLAGIYQVVINTPKHLGKAAYVLETEKVMAQFPRSSKWTSGGTRVVIQKVWSNSAQQDETYYKVPVSIRYRAMS